jgi:hypothetical protein
MFASCRLFDKLGIQAQDQHPSSKGPSEGFCSLIVSKSLFFVRFVVKSLRRNPFFSAPSAPLRTISFPLFVWSMPSAPQERHIYGTDPLAFYGCYGRLGRTFVVVPADLAWAAFKAASNAAFSSPYKPFGPAPTLCGGALVDAMLVRPSFIQRNSRAI